MGHWTLRGAVYFAVAFACGCELLVPDTVPPFICNSPDNSCPPGMTCNMATHECGYPGDVIPPTDTGVMDATAEDSFVPPTDAPTEAVGPCRGLGCTCSGAADCDSHICADQATVTPGLYSKVGHGFCIAPCCTSNDCAGGFVCFATAAGGSYCVNPSLIGRAAPGTTAPGAACSTDTQCRSGLCATTCQDTCCSNYKSNGSAECSGGGACRFGAFPGRGIDTHFGPHCTASGGGKANGGYCTSNAQCDSNFCAGNFCYGACRNSSDCVGGYCNYQFDSSNNVFATCTNGTGSTGLGGACTSSTTCSTWICDPTSMKCTDTCFGDSDCAAMSGWACRPELISVMGGGSASVLVCGN